MTKFLKPIRTALFIPLDNERALSKAHSLNADLIILDLEDAVFNKVKARQNLLAYKPSGKEILRINHPETPEFIKDIKYIKDYEILLPKAETKRDIEKLRAHTNAPIWLNIETPMGFVNLKELCETPDIKGLFLGANDLYKELGIAQTKDRQEIAYTMQQLVLYAKAYNLYAFDAVYNNFNDDETLAKHSLYSKSLGFNGKAIIHPKQIEIVNNAFKPSPEEIEKARAILKGFENIDSNVININGEMFERLHLEAAEHLLKLIDFK